MGRESYRFIFAVEDQRDWQSVKGCFSNPFSCFFCHLLRVFGVRKVLDLNYGKGSFYEKCRNELEIVGVDIVKWDWVVQPTRFIQGDMVDVLNTINEKFDAVVLDPPYNVKPTSRIIEEREYLYFGNVPFPKVIKAIRVAKEKGIARYVILKYMPVDYSEEIELLRMAKYRVIWRFVHSNVVRNSENKVIRNYTELFII